MINNLTRSRTKVLMPNLQSFHISIPQKGFIKLSKNMLIMYLILFFTFTGVTGLFLFNPFGTKQADAAWFNDSWGYRKEVPITAHSTDETDTYISVTLADTDDLVTAGQLQSDCGDMRFTKQNGDILPYYIASGCNSSSTVVHVYLDSFPAGAQTIYFYYNNPLVSDGFEPADFSTEASSYTVGTIGSTENAPSPFSYWKFDEGEGSTSNDSMTSAKSGTITNATWQTEDLCVSGSCLAFDGSGDYVDYGTSLPISSAFTISAWVKLNSNTVADYVRPIFVKGSWGGDGVGDVRLEIATDSCSDQTGAARFAIEMQTSSGTACINDTIDAPTDTWVYVSAVWDGSNISLYRNGVQVATGALGGTLTNNAHSTYVGAYPNNTANTTLDGSIDEVKIYNQSLSAPQILANYNSRSNPEGVSVALGTSTQNTPAGTPLGYWKFDEGYSTIAHNSGSAESALDLTLSNFASPATSTSGWSNSGKFSKALNFDGTNDDAAASSSETASDDLANMTISAWIYPRSGGSDLGRIFDKSNAGSGISLLVDSGHINFSVSHASQNLVHITSASVTFNSWQHIAVTWDGSTSASNAKIYINGVEQTSYLETTDGSGARTSDASQAVRIGGRNDGLRIFDGLIDEVKLFDQILTPAQIQVELNKGQAQVLGTTGDNTNFEKSAEAQKYCVPGDTSTCTGPVLNYDLNEGTGTTANDSSGYENGGAGNIIPGNGSWVNGKSDGKAYSFDGLSTHIFGGSNSILDNLGTSGGMTAEVWIYPKSRGIDSNNAFILAKNVGNSQATGGWLLLINGISGNQVGLQFVVDGSTDLVRGTPATTVTLNQWNHVVVSWNGVMTTASSARIFVNGKEATYSTTTNGSARPSDASSSLYIGNASSVDRSFDGYIDQVKIFNYNRTPAQIAYDYNQGKPVGYWKMDECQGTTINDSSGNGFTGALTNATAGTCSTSSTAWGDGATGKRNASLSLDGTNDYVDLGTISSPVGTGDVPFSISAWVKPSTVRLDGCVFSYGGASSGQVISLCSDGSGKIYSVHYGNDHSFTTAWTLGAWQHVIITYDPVTSTETLYLNGQSKESWTPSNLDLQSSATSYLGRASWNGVYLNSTLIDDVRLYNYPLTATQAKNLANDGAYRVGPSTGSP